MVLFMDNWQALYNWCARDGLYKWLQENTEWILLITVYMSALKEKEKCRILTNKEIYAMVKNPTIRDNKVK